MNQERVRIKELSDKHSLEIEFVEKIVRLAWGVEPASHVLSQWGKPPANLIASAKITGLRERFLWTLLTVKKTGISFDQCKAVSMFVKDAPQGDAILKIILDDLSGES